MAAAALLRSASSASLAKGAANAWDTAPGPSQCHRKHSSRAGTSCSCSSRASMSTGWSELQGAADWGRRPSNVLSVGSIRSSGSRRPVAVRAGIEVFEQQRLLRAELAASLEQKKFRQALELLRSLLDAGGQPSSRLCMQIVSGLCKAGKPQNALDVFQEVSAAGVSFSYSEFHELIQTLAKGKNPEHGCRALQLLKEAGHSPNLVTYSILISSLARAASSRRRGGLPHAQMAYDTWQELQDSGLELDPTALRTGLNACVSLGRQQEAEAIFQSLRKQSALDVRSCNILIKGYAQRGEAGKAEAVLESMRAKKVSPDDWTYNTLVSAYVEGADLPGALGVLQEARGKGYGKELAPSFSSLIKGYADEGRGTEALEVLKEMESARVRPNNIHLAAVVGALSNIGDLDRAKELLDSMEESFGLRESIQVYNNYVKGVCRGPVGFLQARDVLDDMELREIRPNTDTYNMLMESCCTAEEPAGAIFLSRQMREGQGLEPDNLTYNTLMKAHIMQGDFYEALDVFRELDTQLNGLVPDMGALNMITYVLARMDRMREASAVLDKVDALATRSESPPSPRGYGAVLNGFVTRNSPSEAFAVLQRFRRMGGVPDERMYNSIARMCVRNRDWRRALQVVQAMEARGQEADKEMLVSMITALERRMEENEAAQQDASMSHDHRGSHPRMQMINAGFERFKFWLGLPNMYYNASGDWFDDEAGEEEEGDYEDAAAS